MFSIMKESPSHQGWLSESRENMDKKWVGKRPNVDLGGIQTAQFLFYVYKLQAEKQQLCLLALLGSKGGEGKLKGEDFFLFCLQNPLLVLWLYQPSWNRFRAPDSQVSLSMLYTATFQMQG